jgi:hypothetical protein
MFTSQIFILNTVACRAVSRQRLSKHVPAATNTHETIEYSWKWCFILGPYRRFIRRTTEAVKHTTFQVTTLLLWQELLIIGHDLLY